MIFHSYISCVKLSEDIDGLPVAKFYCQMLIPLFSSRWATWNARQRAYPAAWREQVEEERVFGVKASKAVAMDCADTEATFGLKWYKPYGLANLGSWGFANDPMARNGCDGMRRSWFWPRHVPRRRKMRDSGWSTSTLYACRWMLEDTPDHGMFGILDVYFYAYGCFILYTCMHMTNTHIHAHA